MIFVKRERSIAGIFANPIEIRYSTKIGSLQRLPITMKIMNKTI